MDRSAQQGPVKRTPFVSGSCRAFKMLLCLKMFKTFSTANFALPGWPKAGGTLWFIKWLNIGCFVLFQCPCTTSRTAQFKYIRLAAKSGFIVSRLVSDCCTELRFVNSEPGGRRSRVTLAESGGLTHSDHVHVSVVQQVEQGLPANLRGCSGPVLLVELHPVSFLGGFARACWLT